MNNSNDIVFLEGANHTVNITVSDAINMAIKNAKIQVRKVPGSNLLFEFSSEAGSDNLLTIVDQVVTMNILPALTIGKSGDYNWQLEIWSDTTDSIILPFDPDDPDYIPQFVIKPSVIAPIPA
jgi:hypothetical protein